MAVTDNYKYLIDFIEKDPETWVERLAGAPYFVKAKKHPELPLWKLKYDMFATNFADPIVRCCRGSVVEIFPDGKHAKMAQAPYYKFVGKDYVVGEDDIQFPAWAEDKSDGSLAIWCNMYAHGGLWTTSGAFGLGEIPAESSFDTDVEPETKGLTTFKDLIEYSLDKQGREWISRVPCGWTLMFEILSPRNRIIVKNAETKLVLHGGRDYKGDEHHADEIAAMFDLPFETPEKWRVESWADVDKLLAERYTDGSKYEGLVICDDRWNRVKIKSDPYKALKYVKGEAGFSPKALFEVIKTGEIDDAIAAWPEITDRANEIVTAWTAFIDKVRNQVAQADTTLKTVNNRKDFAMWVQTQPKWLHSYLFLAGTDNIEERLLKLLNKLDYNEFQTLNELA
jgi:hypothetical protein